MEVGNLLMLGLVRHGGGASQGRPGASHCRANRSSNVVRGFKLEGASAGSGGSVVGQAVLPDRPRCSFSRPEQTKRQCLLVACNLNCHRGNASQATVWQISTSVDMIRIIWATSHGPNVKGGAKLTSVKGWIWQYVRWCHLLCNKHPSSCSTTSHANVTDRTSEPANRHVNTGVFMTALISFVVLRICPRSQRLESSLVIILADTAVIVVTLCNSSCLAGQ